MPRAFEIFDETLDDEVKAELKAFASKVEGEAQSLNYVRTHGRYVIVAPLHGDRDLFCFVGYATQTPDGYPIAIVALEARPEAVGRNASVAAMKEIALREDWKGYNLDDPTGWAGAWREVSLTDLLPEKDHVAAVKQFFIESISQLREELTAFNKEHPDLPWNGG